MSGTYTVLVSLRDRLISALHGSHLASRADGFSNRAKEQSSD